MPCGSGTTCRLTMDVHAPVASGPWPVVVLLPGGPSPPGDYTYVNDDAVRLASDGAVVMSAGWRQAPDWGGGWPSSFRDVACAVRVARAFGPRYGAGRDHVTLAGHSLGGWAAAVVGLTSPPLAAPPGTCRAVTGSARPDAVVSLAGAVDEVRNRGLGTGWVRAFFGGTRAERPGAWDAADPYALAGSRPGRADRVPVTVVT
ncbi:MAG: alpha/beta hydrolase, partial [Actinomycetes bacterium]